MADKLGVSEVRELKLGASFTNNKASAFHTIKYDFKPASVDVNKMATVDVGTNNQVTVTVPHLDGAGIPQTVFKGNQRPYTKECVLIIDRVTGQITLEKLSSNIQVKKTRSEANHRPVPGLMPPAPPAPAVVPGPSARPLTPAPAATSRPLTPAAPASAPARPITPSAPASTRPLTPVEAGVGNCTQRNSSRTRVASGARRHNGGGTNAATNSVPSMYHGQPPRTPPSMVRSPQRVRTSPPQAAPWSGGQSTLASLPMIGLDDMSLGAPTPSAPAPAPVVPYSAMPNGFANTMIPVEPTNFANSVPLHNEVDEGPGVMSSSSSSSDSGSDSEVSASDSEPDEQTVPAPANSAAANATAQQVPNLTNGSAVRGPSLMNVLNDDLCLSESGSDSD